MNFDFFTFRILSIWHGYGDVNFIEPLQVNNNFNGKRLTLPLYPCVGQKKFKPVHQEGSPADASEQSLLVISPVP